MKRLLATLILLVASATPSIGKDPPPAYPVVTMESGEGLVMMRLIGTRTIGSFPKWEMLTLHKVKAPPQRKTELHDRFSASLQSTVFMESLPPGDYTPLSLGAFASGGFSDLIASADFPKGYRFTVEAGRLTDLGTLYYVAPYELVPVGSFRLIQAGDHDFARNASFMLEPERAQSLLQSPLGWARIPADTEPGNLKPQTRHLSMNFGGRARTADGSVLFGESFGQIARRTAGGQWTWEETGVVGNIQAAVETPDGKAYAVAEHSTLVRRDSPGHWERIAVPVAGALPCFISVEPDGSLFTAWEDLNAITVLSYQPADATPWRLRIRIPLEGWPKATNPIRRCAVLVSQPKMMVLDYAYSNSGIKFGYHVLDRVSSTWMAYRREDFQGWVGMFPDGTVYSLAGWQPGQDFQIAADLGQKWQKLTEVSWADCPQFRDRNEGYFMRVDNAPQPYLEKRKYSLWRTMDGGKSWARHVSLPPLVASFMLLDGKDMLFPTLDGRLLVSHDNGATVALERDSSLAMW
jgi:hypothetical protein